MCGMNAESRADRACVLRPSLASIVLWTVGSPGSVVVTRSRAHFKIDSQHHAEARCHSCIAR